MPMPPPPASTERRRDRQTFHEMGQIVRALEANGPQPPERLAELVGGPTGSTTGSSARSPSSSTTGWRTRHRTAGWRPSDARAREHRRNLARVVGVRRAEPPAQVTLLETDTDEHVRRGGRREEQVTD